jgi:hypothetical protein
MSDNDELLGTNAFVSSDHWDHNVYNDPEDFGLKIVHGYDNGEGYDFDKFIVWVSLETGTLYWQRDRGCSCPRPFEGILKLSDLEELTTRSFTHFTNALAGYNIPKKEQITFTRIANRILGFSKGELELYIGLGKSWHGTQDQLIDTCVGLH